MSPETKKMTVDKVCGKIAEIMKNDIEQILMEKTKADIEKYLARKKQEGKIPRGVYLKLALLPEILYCDPEIAGSAGVEERFGQPIMVTIM